MAPRGPHACCHARGPARRAAAAPTLGALPRSRAPRRGRFTIVCVSPSTGRRGPLRVGSRGHPASGRPSLPRHPPMCDWFSASSSVTAWTLDRGGPRHPQGGGLFSAPHDWFTVRVSRTAALRGPTRGAPTPPCEPGAPRGGPGVSRLPPPRVCVCTCVCARECVRPLGAHVLVSVCGSRRRSGRSGLCAGAQSARMGPPTRSLIYCLFCQVSRSGEQGRTSPGSRLSPAPSPGSAGLSPRPRTARQAAAFPAAVRGAPGGSRL